MTALITLFAISVIGLVFMVVGKRVDAHFLLPEVLYRRDEELERTVRYHSRRLLVLAYYKMQMVWHIIVGFFYRGFSLASKSGKTTKQENRTLMRKGSASFFLKHVNEYKHHIRKEEE